MAASFSITIPDGIRCWACKGRHATVDEVGECHAELAEDIAEAEAERLAELRNEQYFENRGWQEALAQDEWEAQRGVIQFQDAWDLADPSRVVARQEAAALGL